MALPIRVTIIFTRQVMDVVPSNLEIEELDRVCYHIADQIEKKFRDAFKGEAENIVVAVEQIRRQDR